MAATKKIKTVGSKRMVWAKTADHTPSGLKRKDLMMTKRGRIVSKKQHAAGKKAIQRLFKLGFKPKKGQFTLMRKSMVNGRRTSKAKK
jgi:hypothetical protein